MSTSIWKSIGPGILFAGAAIGTSHLVQSTRAGALFGLGLLFVVILANVVKYPGFRFGPFYAAATGKSLIEGYRSIGRPVVILLALVQLPVQIIIIAATTLTASGLAIAVFGLNIDIKVMSCIMLFAGATILLTGGFTFLTKITKVFVVVLTVTTLLAALMVLPSVALDFTPTKIWPADIATLGFVLALCGFMPSSLDLSIWHSLWSVAQDKASGRRTPINVSMLDFNIGYVTTSVLAICFLFMGAGTLYSSGVAPANSAAEFAAQIIALYTNQLGAWSGSVVGISAFGVMLTTLITVLDGVPRVQAASIATLINQSGRVDQTLDKSRLLKGTTVALTILAGIAISFFLVSFTTFVDMVTISAFIVGPVIAGFNHYAVFHLDVPVEHIPKLGMRLWSIASVLLMAVISVYFIALKFF